MKLILTSVLLLALTGCATNDYKLYAETQQKIAQSQAMVETARYAALSDIAKQGDTTAKVVAVMSLQMGSSNNNNNRSTINAPVTMGDKALQWASVLVPSLTQLYGINANRQLAITQSNNQAAVAQSTNATFATMNGNMARSNADIASSGLTAVTGTASSGLTAATTIASSGLTAVTDTASSGLTAVTDTASSGLTGMSGVVTNMLTMQPNVTTSTTSSTSTTTNNTNAIVCPAGTTLTNGICI
jgi:hypothetical protein